MQHIIQYSMLPNITGWFSLNTPRKKVEPKRLNPWSHFMVRNVSQSGAVFNLLLEDLAKQLHP